MACRFSSSLLHRKVSGAGFSRRPSCFPRQAAASRNARVETIYVPASLSRRQEADNDLYFAGMLVIDQRPARCRQMARSGPTGAARFRFNIYKRFEGGR